MGGVAGSLEFRVSEGRRGVAWVTDGIGRIGKYGRCSSRLRGLGGSCTGIEVWVEGELGMLNLRSVQAQNAAPAIRVVNWWL